MNATAPNPELLTALRPALERAEGLIERRLEDARAHAAAGSLPTAENRLKELTVSLNRHIGEARAHFYRAAFGQHGRIGLDPDVHRLDLGPTAEGEAAARRAAIMGRDYTIDLLDFVCDARAGLQSATLAGGGDYLDAWQLEHRERLTGRVRGSCRIVKLRSLRQLGRFS